MLNDEQSESLPFGMRVAAITTELDNIQVVPVNEPLDIRWAIYASPDTEDYESKLIKKLASVINENIKYKLEKNPDVKLYVYVFAELIKDGNMMAAISKCEIK